MEKIASVFSCEIMDLQYYGFVCQNMSIVHFHEYVQEIKDGLIEIFFGPLVLPLMQSNHPQEKSRSPLMPNK